MSALVSSYYHLFWHPCTPRFLSSFQIGTTVLSVFARDLDAGENGEIVYSLGEGEGHNYLAINSKSGVIQTAAPLDREALSLIR